MTKKQEVIKQIKDQLNECRDEDDWNNADWKDYTGILLTPNQAKYILGVLE